jgi:hypothetical protein
MAPGIVSAEGAFAVFTGGVARPESDAALRVGGGGSGSAFGCDVAGGAAAVLVCSIRARELCCRERNAKNTSNSKTATTAETTIHFVGFAFDSDSTPFASGPATGRSSHEEILAVIQRR